MKRVEERIDRIKVNDYYFFNRNELKQIKEEDYEFVNQVTETKRQFSLTVKSSVENFFGLVLLYSELKTRRDCITYTLDEWVEVFNTLLSKGLISSFAAYERDMNTVYNYTKWGYNKKLRNDAITTEDFNSKIKFSDYIQKSELTAKILTKYEMNFFIGRIGRDDVKLAFKAATEGLTIDEVLSIQLTEFWTIKNHPINTGTRIINVSDDLYAMMYDYSILNSVPKIDRWNNKTYIFLGDTGHLIRPTQTTNFSINTEKLQTSHFNTIIKKEMIEIGYDGTFGDFRMSSMLLDYLDGKDIDYINNKYGTKTNHVGYFKSKRKAEIEVLIDKLNSEK